MVEFNPDAVEITLAASLDRLAKNAARNAVVVNALADPAKPNVVWRAAGEGCEWCRQRDGMPVDPQASGSHHACQCYGELTGFTPRYLRR